ncbi:MAG: YtxH domain-containing protein [Bacteroidales bacterium]|nr:YtxH domain-containing protein [Bacteroidales bacterium]
MRATTLFSFLAGAAVGMVATAAFLSSSNGDEIREKIKEALDDGYDKARENYEKIRTKVKDVADEVEDRVRDEAETVKEKVKEGAESVRSKVKENHKENA